MLISRFALGARYRLGEVAAAGLIIAGAPARRAQHSRVETRLQAGCEAERALRGLAHALHHDIVMLHCLAPASGACISIVPNLEGKHCRRRHNIMHKVGPEARLSVSGTLAVSSHRQQPQHNSRRLHSSRLANPNTTQRSRYSTRLSCDHRTGPSGQQRGRGSGSELRAHPVHRAVLPLQPAYGKPLPCLALPLPLP